MKGRTVPENTGSDPLPMSATLPIATKSGR